MRKLDFQNFSIPTGISKRNKQTDDEIKLIQEVAEKLCTPNFIDGLQEQLTKGGNE